ncbi:MAG TPA: DUF4397 domain-containing protein [Chitinophagaceae bacterium]|jgi:hypothetical protein
MKKLILILSIIGVSLFSCTKDYNHREAPYNSNLSGSAFLKVIDATVGSSKNYVYADATPLTGATISNGSAFPANGTYSAIAPGSRTIMIKDTSAASIQKVISASGNFNAGSYYSIFTYDTSANANYILLQDTLVTPNDGSARLRFANLIFSSAPVSNVDVYSAKQQQNVFSNVAIGQVTGFIPFPSATTDTLFVRSTGTTDNLAQINAFAPGSQRSYTIVFAGRYQTTSGSGARTVFSVTNK